MDQEAVCVVLPRRRAHGGEAGSYNMTLLGTHVDAPTAMYLKLFFGVSTVH